MSRDMRKVYFLKHELKLLVFPFIHSVYEAIVRQF